MSSIPNFDSLFKLDGKTAVVTGGSRGIGLHAATGLLLAGCSTLIITSRKADACDAAVKSLYSVLPAGRKAKILAIPSDLSKPTEVERFVKEIAKVTDKVHILIANAGATWGAKLEEHPDAAFAKVMDLNVRSVFNLIRESTPLLAAAASIEDPARIITVGSVAGIVIGSTGNTGTFGYAASKAAVLHMTKHLAIALKDKYILANALAPGLFMSKMAKGIIDIAGGEEELAKVSPNGRLGRPDDIAGVVVFLCSRAGSHINASVIPVDGGRYVEPASTKL